MTDYLLVMAMMTIALIAVLIALVMDDDQQVDEREPDEAPQGPTPDAANDDTQPVAGSQSNDAVPDAPEQRASQGS